MKDYAFIEAWQTYSRRAAMILGLSLLSAPLLSVYAEKGVDNIAPQAITQTKNVKGTIIDENGIPLIGVSILVKGTTTGTITDFDGKFSVDLPAGKKELVISYIGYKDETVTVSGNAPLNIKMTPDTKTLDEVVVIGYGTVKKRDLTGAVASVKAEDITRNPGANPMDALQGKVAGLDITKSSGQAGASPTIQLRGTRSLQVDKDGNISSSSFNPTYIIDGMPGDISTLNPNDIESIEVLKDASSTAIYGSSGANGVIIVTTKGSKAGKPVINFNTYAGTSLGAKKPKMRSGDSYIQYVTDSYKLVGTTNLEEIFGERYDAIQNNQWVDWADEVLHSGLKQNYSLSVTGGTEKTKAYFSLNYSDEKSMYKNDNYKVYSTRVRVDQEINKWINAGINVQASFTNKNSRSGVLETALFATPLGRAYGDDGTINDFPIAGSSADPSPLADEQDGVFKNSTKAGKAYVDTYIEWKPMKTLSFRTQLGGSYSNSRSGKFMGEGSYNVLKGSTTPYGSVNNGTGYNYKWENIITYHETFNEVHDLTVTGVTSYNYNQSEEYYIYGENPATNDMSWYALQNANNKSLSSKYLMSKGMGLIGRINYSYKGKYLFSASGRYDGSSRLAKGKQWNIFPAVSGGWRISDEAFMEGTRNWLDNLKIRVGYGVAGTNAGISEYTSMASMENVTTSLGGQTVPSAKFTEYITNRNLTWEKTHDWNLGIDASFLNGRIDMTLDLYKTNTKGVIIAQSLPSSIMGNYSGTTPYKMNKNAAGTENRGIELGINSRNIVKKDFTWNSTVTFTANKEKIKTLIDGQDMAFSAQKGDMVFKVGEAVGSYYKYKVLGVWQYSERENAALFGCEPGDIKLDLPSVKQDGAGYYYTNPDGERVDINAENPYKVRADYDRQVIGHTTPDWTMGFKNDFKYKNFDLSVFFYARWGQMMNYGKVIGKYSPNPDYNIPTYFTYYDKTIEADQNVLFYAIDQSKDRSAYEGYDSMHYVDGSFFKLKNLTLGYTLPDNLVKRLGIGNLRVYATMTNLFTYSPNKYVKNYDPEMNGSIDFPLSRDFVFGLNLTF
ncbi:SusC/RagA family TonB-linked outer membrane protein [Bacteroides reticulotermitis]|uniref:TonB-dependent receptor n=2 Tax=Bacteroides reticulotermitis TaxID=1133319 RepID=W4UQG8_9BACE|nr:TonB-dependent receptor [Bacteroides reticulotermitis]MBB4042933.1 TonB-linked SusC/RagA family outer membrane protein [Bacteroides reticulotermitis]GAE83047.1 TonB-dependent receptor [Bacteroides reticulotermitis JCM 10512]HJD76974.1 TonB-dependent receptor [Bacteroides reticulotermitis]